MKTSRRIGAVLTGALALVAAACGSESNTAPLVATNISVVSSTNAQTGIVGQGLALPVTVQVTDQNGTALSNAIVTWTVMAGAGAVANATSTTDATGIASMTWTLGNLMGVDSLTASLAGGASAVITATAMASTAASLSMVSGDAQSVTSGATTEPLVVKLTDQFGNPIADVEVTWIVVGGGALSTSSVTTDSTGMAHITLTTDAAPATYSVTATAGALSAVVFTINGT